MPDFVLDTSSMDAAASKCQELSHKMKLLKDELINEETKLLFCWEGKGRNEFEKQFRLLKNQLGDISDTLMETGEKILNAEQSYIQTDTDAAKSLEGISRGNIDSDKAESIISNAVKSQTEEV